MDFRIIIVALVIVVIIQLCRTPKSKNDNPYGAKGLSGRKDGELGGLWEHINKKSPPSSSREFYASKEWRRLRYQAFKIYGGNCACCGRSAKDGLKMHVDHIKPRSRYPELALKISNLQILCEECNLAKSNTDDIKWRR
ncbi:HNH endonuclease [Klebsiella aerogenes]|uniref:HNH endonuclease n=1 Tax=Klebsiella aerogenes TaxID=548 RepID=UPI000D93E000|nr:HNH endonuclease signature motif containing protein [Klebsiella aerogenes]PYZ36470.1 HNH endonuclease [Klebsiella aerogenes]HCL5638186.1 HNH endonuclease [Klebsiella aerogenes]